MEVAGYFEAVCTRQHGVISQKRVHSTISHGTICNLNIHSHENIISHTLFFYASCHHEICHKRLLHAEQSLRITALKLYRMQSKNMTFLKINLVQTKVVVLSDEVHFRSFYVHFLLCKNDFLRWLSSLCVHL
jgi:hypothetical protein